MNDGEDHGRKNEVVAEVDRLASTLIEVSHSIFDQPELGFEERHAHDVLCSVLDDAGFDVERHAFGLDTGFAARAGDSGPLIAVLCEYDALPGIGHACGHNIIAAAGVGAAIAAASVSQATGGRILVLGTPAEEGGGGKVLMARKGALDDVDAAMMIHPGDHDLTEMTTIAIHQIHVDYYGQESHAAAAPHLGRNALDAAVLGYMNVAALRQHIGTDERIHGVFTDGGARPNVVPGHASMLWYVRSTSLASLEPLKERVFDCLQAGATATGCTMEHRWNDPPYADLITNHNVLDAFVANARDLGRDVQAPTASTAIMGSTDMGNVSYLTPTIHPMVRAAPPGVSIHTPEFARCARGDAGDIAVLDGARAMAATVVDLWTDPDLLSAARSEWSTMTSGGHPPVI
jgi:amidohydrolase